MTNASWPIAIGRNCRLNIGMYPADRDQSQQPWMPDGKVESSRGLGYVKSGPKLGKTLELWAKTKNCTMGVASGQVVNKVPFCRKRLAPSHQRPMSSASPSSIRTIRASPCLETALELSQLQPCNLRGGTLGRIFDEPSRKRLDKGFGNQGPARSERSGQQTALVLSHLVELRPCRDQDLHFIFIA